jgi:hypothetical protein
MAMGYSKNTEKKHMHSQRTKFTKSKENYQYQIYQLASACIIKFQSNYSQA